MLPLVNAHREKETLPLTTPTACTLLILPRDEKMFPTVSSRTRSFVTGYWLHKKITHFIPLLGTVVIQLGNCWQWKKVWTSRRLFSAFNVIVASVLQFHQTLLTYIQDRVWDFNFYVANNWPDDAICLHFPGMTLSVSIKYIWVNIKVRGHFLNSCTCTRNNETFVCILICVPY